MSAHRSSCVYCGDPTKRGRLTCEAHSDLPVVDPRYALLSSAVQDRRPTGATEPSQPAGPR